MNIFTLPIQKPGRVSNGPLRTRFDRCNHAYVIVQIHHGRVCISNGNRSLQNMVLHNYC